MGKQPKEVVELVRETNRRRFSCVLASHATLTEEAHWTTKNLHWKSQRLAHRLLRRRSLNLNPFHHRWPGSRDGTVPSPRASTSPAKNRGRLERLFDSATRISTRDKDSATNTTTTSNGETFQSIGTPSLPCIPCIHGRKSKYSKLMDLPWNKVTWQNPWKKIKGRCFVSLGYKVSKNIKVKRFYLIKFRVQKC